MTMMRTTALTILAAGLVLVPSAGCSKETNVSMGGGGASGTGTGGGTSRPTLPDCSEAGAAPGAHGPSMVSVGRTDGTCFWMDETEVSRGDYEQFLTAPDAPTTQDVPCAWNTSLDPDAECEASPTVSDADDHPIVCVDWCDAAAYCAWAGKALCRGSYTRPKDSDVDSWYAVCTHGAENPYPYGKNYDAEVCNGADKGLGSTAPVTQGTACVTPEGIRALSGNVTEWTDECEDATGADDACRAYGGSYRKTGGSALACDAKLDPARSTAAVDLGFRCCAYEP